MLLDTVDAFALYGVRHELAVRRWVREWPDVESGAGLMGRWPGARDGGYPEAVSFRLPTGVARQVWAGCWSVSGAAVASLRDWRDRYPGIVVSRSGRERGAQEALAEYEQLADQIARWVMSCWPGWSGGSASRRSIFSLQTLKVLLRAAIGRLPPPLSRAIFASAVCYGL